MDGVTSCTEDATKPCSAASGSSFVCSASEPCNCDNGGVDSNGVTVAGGDVGSNYCNFNLNSYYNSQVDDLAGYNLGSLTKKEVLCTLPDNSSTPPKPRTPD